MSTKGIQGLFKGSVVKNKGGDVVDLQTLDGKIVGIYFSVSWFDDRQLLQTRV